MKLLLSVKYACAGIIHCTMHERNFRIQLVCAVCTITAGIMCRLDPHDWCIILLCIGSVLCLEMINTAIERICNLVHPGNHPAVKIIKDVSAAAVLFFCIIALTCAVIIFYPFIINI